MGKGTNVVKPILPDELKGLYSESAKRVLSGQQKLPLTGRMYGGGGGTPVTGDDTGPRHRDPSPGGGGRRILR